MNSCVVDSSRATRSAQVFPPPRRKDEHCGESVPSELEASSTCGPRVRNILLATIRGALLSCSNLFLELLKSVVARALSLMATRRWPFHICLWRTAAGRRDASAREADDTAGRFTSSSSLSVTTNLSCAGSRRVQLDLQRCAMVARAGSWQAQLDLKRCAAGASICEYDLRAFGL